MRRIIRNKLVVFGAGKIGRSFIGQIFGAGGYEVVFIDLNKALIEELNARGNYNVVIKSEIESVVNIKNVRGVYVYDRKRVISEVASAGIVAVSVGLNGLTAICPLLADGLMERYRIDSSAALDILIAENMRNADEYFEKSLRSMLPGWYPLNTLVGLAETSIGKMVPIMKKADLEEDMLQIFAEPYNSLIFSRKAFKNPIPDIDGLAPKDNIKAWVDRKLFIHNLGHAASAYIGYQYDSGFVFLFEALAVPEVISFVRETMLQSASILMKKYYGEFSEDDLTEHVDDLLMRFQNKALGDTIFRVGCDLRRKLGSDDRLAGAIKAAIALDLPYDKMLFTLICACRFMARDENGNMLEDDIRIIKQFEKGPASFLKEICGFTEAKYSGLIKEFIIINKEFNRNEARGRPFSEFLYEMSLTN